METEGLNLKYSRPWQLSYLVCEGNKIIEEKDEFIWWDDLNINPEAQRICGFNYENYKSKCKISKEEILKRFDEILYDKEYSVIGHNILGYDVFIHNVLRRACGFKTDYSYVDRVIDTLCMSKAYKENDLKKTNGENILSWQYKWLTYVKRGLKTNLGAMAKELDIPFDETKAHDGLYDIKINFEVYNKLIYKLEI
jgi:DNA polymerase III epsilon subunit-like protein